MKYLKASIAISLLALLPSTRVAAQGVPLAISYQAVLTDDAGSPLSPASPTNYPLVFRIYDAAEDGNLLWSEAQNVSVFQGSFSTLLGTGDEVTGEAYPQLDSIFDEALRYLEITITDGGSDKTFTPRQRMVSAPFAFRAKVAEHALTVADTAIATDQIANGTVTVSKLADNSVSAAKIQAGAVGASEIATNGVGTAEIASGAVTLDELAQVVMTRLQPAGSVTAWAGIPATRGLATGEYLGGVPSGWLLCDGRSVPVASYPALFNVIGYIYGGSGSNFNLPDYRGYFLRGQSTRTAQDPDRASRTRASSNATTNGLLEGSIQGQQVQRHRHTWSHRETSQNSGDANNAWDTGGGVQGTRTYNTSNTGGNETRPKNRYVWYIIKAH